MDNHAQLLIYLDISSFALLIAFFVILFKSDSKYKDNQKDGGI